ncbi:hypothetical protein SAMN05660226_03425 [Parapedobacter luteus]|uniref:Uncharacterized protein n=1 Tax=Parapedobacter luteus TaxID=623280 RepID=A0A1T5EMB1_9SPHI|nr:hypothetical protein SAMN05660226_03425 [Parapedobacter luteus]
MAVAFIACMTRRLKLSGRFGSFFLKKYMVLRSYGSGRKKTTTLEAPKWLFFLDSSQRLFYSSEGLFRTFVGRADFVIKPAIFKNFPHGIVKVTGDDQVAESTPPIIYF